MARRKKTAKRKRASEQEYIAKQPMRPETKRGIIVVLLFLLGLISLLSLFSLAGPLGDLVAVGLVYLAGWGDWLMPVIFLLAGFVLLKPQRYQPRGTNWLGLFIFILSFYALLHISQNDTGLTAAIGLGHGGGALGLVLSWPLLKIFGVIVSSIVLAGLLIISLLLMFNASFDVLFGEQNIWQRMIHALRHNWLRRKYGTDDGFDNHMSDAVSDEAEDNDEEPDFLSRELVDNMQGDAANEADEGISEDDKNEEVQVPESASQELVTAARQRVWPKIDFPLELLSGKIGKPTSGDIRANQEIIVKTLDNFGVDVELGEVNVGPTVTQYTLRPAEGVKLSRITALGNDLALALAAHPIRIEAPIPGKSLVGIEMPNKAAANVALKELLGSGEFKRERSSNLTIALGKDVAGKPYLIDLKKMPHMLIAGATGSGKSVAINTLLVSLMYQNQPKDLQFIIVDPKRVELTSWADVPYLLAPVMVDVKKTITALKWAVGEMDRRLEMLSKSGQRNIEAYNKKLGNSHQLPYIVVVIDELADLMAVAAAEVEAAIVRLAQMARAVGIHLVVATQRPSVDVLTGLIKANITSRLAFFVPSLVDSRTILDMSGAEKLLGRGDMLFMSAEVSKPKRLQGAYLTDTEIETIAGYLKKQAKPQYIELATSGQPGINSTSEGLTGSETEELLDEAKQVISSVGKASASLLQRRLRVGYARAARILDILEEQGLIGPAVGAKPREIYFQSGHEESESGE